jgi:N-acetylmuramoyl-L-alanine amidase
MLLSLLLAAQVAASPPPLQAIVVTSTRGTRRVAVVTERGFPALAIAAVGAAVTAWEAGESTVPGTAVVRLGGSTFVFVLDAGYFRCDDGVYTLAAGPYVARDSLFVPLQFVTEYLPRLTGRFRWDAGRARLQELAPAVADARVAPPVRVVEPAPTTGSSSGRTPGPKRRVIAIDAGHGGVDQGMSGPLGRHTFLKEKDVTLAVARQLARELESRGFATVLTRSRDTLIALGDRGRIAGRADADLFVSIHVNAANPHWRNGGAVRGFETYYLAEARTEDAARVARMENESVRFETSVQADRGDPMSFILRDLAQNEHLRESSRLAELVQGSLDNVHPAESRGVKQAGFMVLATSYMPAILVETGFGTNDAEARYLTSASGQQRLARAIADGVARYMTEYERRVASAGQR